MLRDESDRAEIRSGAEAAANAAAQRALDAQQAAADADKRQAARDEALDLDARQRRCREFPDGLRQLRALGLRKDELPAPPPGCNSDGTGTATSIR